MGFDAKKYSLPRPNQLHVSAFCSNAKAWLERPCGTHVLPPVSNTHYCRVIGLGGGGCGKSWMLNHMIRPLIRIFSRHQFLLPSLRHKCWSTVDFRPGLSCSLRPRSQSRFAHTCSSDTKKRLESALQHVACVAGDEVSQVSAPLLHASNLRFMYACMWKHSLNTALYMQPSNWLLVWKNFRCPPSG